LLALPRQQIVLTLPELLRRYFRRGDIQRMSECFRRLIIRFFAGALGSRFPR
jgi:hypothetical protein